MLARGGVKEVGGAGGVAVVIVSPRSDDGDGAADRDGDAEEIALRAVVGKELGDLYGIRGVRDVEQVGRAGVGAVVVVVGCPDDGDGAADRYGSAEEIALRAILGQEFGDLIACRYVKQVGRAGAAAVVVVSEGPDDGGGAADRDGEAEDVERRAVVGEELGDLVARGGVEEVGGAGGGAVVVVPEVPDDGGGPVDRDGPAELVVCRPVVGQELEKLIAEVGVGRGGAQD